MNPIIVCNTVCMYAFHFQELIEAVVLPMTHAEKFESIGIKAPKGVLLYGDYQLMDNS